MVRWVVLVGMFGAAACNFRDGVAPGSIDAPPVFDDGGHEVRVWSFDTGAELATGTTTGIAVDTTRGSLTEEGYVYGSLLMYGHDAAAAFTTSDPPENFVWEKISPLAPSGVAVWPGFDIDDGTNLDFIGVTDNAAFTSWLVGDVHLAAGTHTFQVDADGVAFLEIAVNGTFQRVTTNVIGTTKENNPVTIATAGWYPIRIGWANATDAFRLSVRHALANGTLAPLRRTELRAHATDVAGMLRWVFYIQMLGTGDPNDLDGFPIPSIQQGPFAPQVDLNAAPPHGSGGSPGSSKDWSMRYLGQVYVTQPGAYTFAVHSDDGQQIRAGAQTKATMWDRNAGTITDQMLQTNLDAGWNDLVVDYNQVGGMASFGVQVMDGPELAGAPIPADRLRPVEPRVDRIVSGASSGGPIQNNGGMTDAQIDLAGDPSEDVTGVDVTVQINADYTQLLIELISPDNMTTSLANHENNEMVGTTPEPKHHYYVPFATPKKPGRWIVRVRDNTGGPNVNANFVAATVTMHTSGGPDQIAKTGTWLSPIIDHQTRLYSIDDVTWTERVPAGGTPAQVFLRSCDMADCSDEPSWGSALAQHAMPALALRRYMQAKIVLGSDGTHESELQSFQVMYKRDL